MTELSMHNVARVQVERCEFYGSRQFHTLQISAVNHKGERVEITLYSAEPLVLEEESEGAEA